MQVAQQHSSFPFETFKPVSCLSDALPSFFEMTVFLFFLFCHAVVRLPGFILASINSCVFLALLFYHISLSFSYPCLSVVCSVNLTPLWVCPSFLVGQLTFILAGVQVSGEMICCLFGFNGQIFSINAIVCLWPVWPELRTVPAQL